MTSDRAESDVPLPDLDSVVPLSDKSPPGQNEAFLRAHKRAREFLRSHKWVEAIEEEHLGACLDRILYIFLFKIRPTQSDIDPWLWVIIGDLPSAYVVCDDCKTPAEALLGYIEEMQRWVAAARAGEPVDHLIPVNVPPTPEYAEMLGSRLKFLEENVLPLLVEEAPTNLQ